MAPPQQSPASESVKSTVVVGIDKDKNSHFALRWATDNIVTEETTLTLVHVRHKALKKSTFNGDELFSPFRGFCARKGVKMEEVVVEETEVSRGLLDYIVTNSISNVVVGASHRNAFVRTFKHHDVPSTILKSAPGYCSVYVVGKGKLVQVRPRQSSPGGVAGHLKTHQMAPTHKKKDGGERLHSMKVGHMKISPETLFSGKRKDHLKSPRRDRAKSAPTSINLDLENACPFPPNSLSVTTPNNPGMKSQAPSDVNFSTKVTPESTDVPSSSQKEIEAEMEKLKQELKQTMDMYSTACKEALSAKQMAVELNKWKIEELHRIEEAKHAEEAALAMVEKEKANSKAAIEEAMAARKLATKEAKKRRDAELNAKHELEEKNKALTILAEHDFRYRKYSIEEIEEATDKFSSSMKIGEGGYGPVFKGKLDRTPVAIKVLRPDAAQGRKQFQQEVEVLSCIRHPNMVLLLGACPEYGCLVYEHLENGSLEDRLLKRGNSPPLSWKTRFKIAAEITTALLFLHQAKPEPLVHRDLKPANILIDRNFVSKISDVGLARLVPPSVADSVTQYHITSAAGTFCYIDPEYQQTGKLTTKSDIYSMGVMLLQIITARPAMGISHHVQKAISDEKFEDILDPAVTDWPVEESLAFAKLALQCTELSKKDRPDLGTVVVPELKRLCDFACDSQS